MDEELFKSLRESCHAELQLTHPRLSKKLAAHSYHLDIYNVDKLDYTQKSFRRFSAYWYAMKRQEYFNHQKMIRNTSCTECGQHLQHNLPGRRNIRRLPRRDSGLYCQLCHRLYTNFKSLDEELTVVEYLTHGHIPCHQVWKVLSSNPSIPFPKKPSNCARATKEDLIQLALDSDMRCAISGWPILFGHGSWWSMSLDHVYPISKAKKLTSYGTSIKNLQLTSYILNQVKDDDSQDAIVSWFCRWRDHQKRKRSFFGH
ncbi:hypothetical protein BY458DRAFT_508386 [Sporodiniella umbellata]|nr:hypothetical protein BY458DRAFT_508386 [Sporodiniella umbellata]